ncbi:hypothetical protein AX17_000449 [Amanita inopinata Kibby_2008]|nr:hypothetical protein AX17_000449 [Amanita inopinata Kibby_2008]
MTISRSAKITLLLVIDIVFFFVELIVGYAVGSLALVADSFHMLNDVMSLLVALYAIKLAAKTGTDPRYSYGWHRAEILAALINGVFLLALCFSISLEALQRFFTVPDISNPKLIVVVGSLGLASNMVGLFLFHDHTHGHSHGPSSPSPKTPSVGSPSQTPFEADDADSLSKGAVPISVRRRSITSNEEAYSSLYGHPAATRASLVQTANEIASAQPQSPSMARPGNRARPSLETNDFNHFMLSHADISHVASSSHEPTDIRLQADETLPLLKNRNGSSPSGNHTHSHSGSMNMRALVLHVLGDALGNAGVIATGLIIWLSSWQYKFYCDPIISLVITILILSSALPLVRSASFILLQGVPHTVSLDQVRQSILDVEGVLSLHELHVWQLSETKIVASVHVLASRNHDFMPIAANIRGVLHYHGIHSSTIQPEYHHVDGPPGDLLERYQGNSCLILCPPDQECNPMENACCPPLPSEYDV